MRFFHSIAAILAAGEGDELTRAQRETVHRDTVWSEREHVNSNRNVERLAAFCANVAKFRLDPEEVEPRVLAPVKLRGRRRPRRCASVIDLGARRAVR